MCAGLLPRAISTVLDHRAHFKISIEGSLNRGQLASEVLTRSLDFGDAGGNDNLVFDRLFDDRLFIVVGAKHPLATRRSVTLDETARHQWLLPATDGSMVLQSEMSFTTKLELPKSAVTTMSMLVRCELIATNCFLTVMYGSVLRFGNARRVSARFCDWMCEQGYPLE